LCFINIKICCCCRCLAPKYDPRVRNAPWEPPPYSLILDLNQGSGALRDNSLGSIGSKEITTEVTFNERCPAGQVYDPFSDICRVLFCAAGLPIAGGGCSETTNAVPLPKSDSVPISASDSEDHPTPRYREIQDGMRDINLLCPLLGFNRSEYVMFENRSARVLSYSKLYGPDEYILREPILYVCSMLNESSYNVTRNVTEIFVLFKFDRYQGILSFVGVVISLVCLFVQFVIYMCYPALRNVPGKCIVCLVIALFFGQLMYVFLNPRDWYAPACFYFALIMHYSFLAAFLWMNVMAIDICRTFSSEVVYQKYFYFKIVFS